MVGTEDGGKRPCKRQVLEARKGKEVDSSLEPAETTRVLQTP